MLTFERTTILFISADEATKKYDRKQMRLEPLQILYPEVLIVVDYSFYK